MFVSFRFVKMYAFFYYEDLYLKLSIILVKYRESLTEILKESSKEEEPKNERELRRESIRE